jgi:hypothetical protein
MRRMLYMAVSVLTAAAQPTTKIDPTQLKRPLQIGTVLPANCTVGDTYFKTDATAGANLYGCTSANTWSVQGSISNPGLTVNSNGVLAGTRNTANFVTGAGLTTLITDTGSQINIQTALDTAVVQTQQGEQTGAVLLCASSTGSASSYQCFLSPTAAAYSAGMVLHWKPDINGSGGPTTLNVDSLGAKPVKLADGTSDPGNADLLAGRLYNIWYDGSVFRLGGGTVSTVFGRTGAVTAQSGDYSAAQITGLAPSATADTTNAGNITSGLLSPARLPANNRIRSFGYSFGDPSASSALTAGPAVYGVFTVPYACTISAWNIAVDGGTATFDIWKTAAGSAIPAPANSIAPGALPSISSGTAIHSTALPGWTTAVFANDIVAINLNAVAGAKFASLVVECDQ